MLTARLLPAPDAAEAAHGVRAQVEYGVEVVEPEARPGRAGQVDGMAARVLVIGSRR